jgi:hypothetical protein
MSTSSEYAVLVRHADASWEDTRVSEPLVGIEDQIAAAYIGSVLAELGFNLRKVAISENAARTMATAIEIQRAALLGEKGEIKKHPQLNQVRTDHKITRDELRTVSTQGELPKDLNLEEAGEELITHLPQEEVGVTHASRLAGVLYILKEKYGFTTLPRSLVVPCLGFIVIHRELKIPPVCHFEPIPKEISDIMEAV